MKSGNHSINEYAQAQQGKISVSHFYQIAKKRLRLELIGGKDGLQNVIREKIVNRPVLALVGYFKYFGNYRIQFFGRGECGFLTHHPEPQQKAILEGLMQHAIPCIVTSSNPQKIPVLTQLAETKKIPLFHTTLHSSDFFAECTLLLDRIFAKTETLHGTFIDIKGIGVLMMGDSGIGKTECALALIEKGYTLIADDAVQAYAIGKNTLIGRSLELNSGYLECRGIGIINVIQTFGIRAFSPEKEINLVVKLEPWKPGADEERTGIHQAYITLLGRRIPSITIFVRLGRDIPRLVEIAAFVQSLKQRGIHSAQEFNRALIQHIAKNRTGLKQ